MKMYLPLFGTALLVLISGCASTQSTSSSGTAKPVLATQQIPSRYMSTDNRVVDIGRAYEAPGGRNFKNPHLDSCWLADGFKFDASDTLYIAPTRSTAKYHDDEDMPHRVAQKNLAEELANAFRSKGIFANVVTSESDIKGASRVLKMENTIVEYAKGGGGARYWAGIYGAGQPVIRVQGQILSGDQKVFSFDGKRSGVSAGARMFGAFKSDIDIQLEDIRSLALDLSDFIAAVEGKYQAKN